MFSTPTANTMMSNTWENREIIFIVMLFFIDYLCAPPPPAMTSSIVQLFNAKQLSICASALFEQASEQALSVSLQSVFGGVPGGHVVGTYGQASIHPCKLKVSAHFRKAGMLQDDLGAVVGDGKDWGLDSDCLSKPSNFLNLTLHSAIDLTGFGTDGVNAGSLTGLGPFPFRLVTNLSVASLTTLLKP